MTWLEAIVVFVPYAATAGISAYAIRNSTRLKELELKDNERGRVFEIKRQVTIQAIESMKEACFRLGKQANRFAAHEAKRTTDFDPELLKQMQHDRDFIELNKPFFPMDLREDMNTASYQLTSLVKNYEGLDGAFRMEIFIKALPVVQNSKKKIEVFLDEYNMFNEQ